MTAEQAKEHVEAPAQRKEVYGIAGFIVFMQLVTYLYGIGSGAADRFMPLRDAVKETSQISAQNTKRIDLLEDKFSKYIETNQIRWDAQLGRESARDITITKMASQVDNMNEYYKRAQGNK